MNVLLFTSTVVLVIRHTQKITQTLNLMPKDITFCNNPVNSAIVTRTNYTGNPKANN